MREFVNSSFGHGPLSRSDVDETRVAERLKEGFDSLWKRSALAPDGPIDVIDLFSGCGGMSAGFRAVNGLAPTYRLALAVDIAKDANRSYEANLGLTPLVMDVAALARSRKRLPQLIEEAQSGSKAPLVMIGCAPCQGFSSHRNAAGEGDDRNLLFVAFARIAARVQPDAVIVENVPEILTDRYWPIVRKARRILGKAGFHTCLAIHDMADFGVPQNRYRALMIGMRKPFRMPCGFVDTSRHRTVRQTIGHLAPIDPGTVCRTDPMHYTANHRESTIKTIRAVPLDGGSRPYDVGPECLRRAERKHGKAVYEDVYGRLWWDRPSITVTASARNPASGRYVHPEQHRGLSVREAALLQGFPDEYGFEGSFDSKFQQIGNAVPPIFATYLGAHILSQLWEEGGMDNSRGIEAPIGPSFSRLIPSLKAGRLHLDNIGVRFRRSMPSTSMDHKATEIAA